MSICGHATCRHVSSCTARSRFGRSWLALHAFCLTRCPCIDARRKVPRSLWIQCHDADAVVWLQQQEPARRCALAKEPQAAAETQPQLSSHSNVSTADGVPERPCASPLCVTSPFTGASACSCFICLHCVLRPRLSASQLLGQCRCLVSSLQRACLQLYACAIHAPCMTIGACVRNGLIATDHAD